ncbi:MULTISPECIES: alpha/beta hydrolase [unclassified Bradyrhizobium]|uniref:alpha/beta fold hydrolase n=1 Tax=unclassified Bradyrhizobium TaxID=2631580 RepID=UPI002479B7C5|nr:MULTISPECIES: alpha/beta hydrolase [unclassified Bradyrhizobium]WGR68829.1 alpha/beta hydrolase [Bradyrhizobium sp. ISRA426]WGR80884.1 alpha/beta hydrolase [Bradyrhizobium sp. ISRA430]WGR84069.1 alpha/beta hydrolase [Bradyrhizobium sp. ISRA432]
MRRYLLGLYVLGLSFFGPSSNAQLLAQEIKPSWSIPPEIKWEAVNGYPMAYRDAGSGTPIVLVHGSINDYRTWNAQFNVFSETHRVIAVSLRHFYPERWDGVGTDFSIEQHADDVAALIEKLNLGKVHLVGHSRGGAVVIEVAKSHPEVIRTLVLPDASIEMPMPETTEAKEAAGSTKKLVGTLQTNLKTGDPVKAAEVFVDMANAAPGTWLKLSEPVKEMILANIYTGLGDKGRPLTSCDDLKKFDFPVLLMTGDKSPKKFELFYREMRKCKDDLPQTIVIPNAGHAMQRNNPEAFNKVTLAFVSQH